jgi:hypothetical protein
MESTQRIEPCQLESIPVSTTAAESLFPRLF